MNFYFHPDAQAEFDKAVEYYEQFKPGLVSTLPKKSTRLFHVSFSILMHGRHCPRTPVVVWSVGFHTE